ncbi:hypothetical protein FH972_023024 [Carpinus fangiana]|uniref:Large ribosomal subunit protein bL28m n=1 Tax=Carpinus fangiana TaxID=176857 RepID=A0A5N6KUA0_9ROSI|nr:hypothetical protein FH972_023024 [Carpinus fangiana]
MAAPSLCPRALFRTPSHTTSTLLTFSRPFTSTSCKAARPQKTNPDSLLPATAPPPPPYPFSRRLWYKQADGGLYGGATIQFGNNVSERNEIKTRRVWRPNTQFKHLYSVALGRTLRLRVAARVLRTIDKVGGLDNYLLGTSAQRVKELGEEGWRLRWAVLHSPAVQARMAESAALRQMVQGVGEGGWSAEELAAEEGEDAGFELLGEEGGVGEQAVEEVKEEESFLKETQASHAR